MVSWSGEYVYVKKVFKLIVRPFWTLGLYGRCHFTYDVTIKLGYTCIFLGCKFNNHID